MSTVRFKNVIHKLFRNSCHGQKSIGNCLSRNFTGCSCSGVVVQGELLRQKWGNFIESNFPGVNFPRRNYSGRYVLGLIAFEEISWEKLSGGSCLGAIPGYRSLDSQSSLQFCSLFYSVITRIIFEKINVS